MKTTYAITVAKCPPDEGGKSCDHLSTNHKAANCITECNDREGAKLVKSVTECQSSEFEVSSIYYNQKSNFPMASINLKKINQFFLRTPEITSGSSSGVEVVDARLEAVTTGSREV